MVEMDLDLVIFGPFSGHFMDITHKMAIKYPENGQIQINFYLDEVKIKIKLFDKLNCDEKAIRILPIKTQYQTLRHHRIEDLLGQLLGKTFMEKIIY